jgi:asparagine synthase (glutamine-hydrolysing)
MIDKKMVIESSFNYKNIFRLQYDEIYRTQLPHLLKYEDRNSMKHSIETRLPFLDYNVLECAVNAKKNLKIKDGWTKYLLRKSVEKILPEDIVWRKNKMGFEAPNWINNFKDEMIKIINKSNLINTIKKCDINFEVLEDNSIWKLFNIAKWEETFDVKVNTN